MLRTNRNIDLASGYGLLAVEPSSEPEKKGKIAADGEHLRPAKLLASLVLFGDAVQWGPP
jgi:hypothetical protein